MPSPLPVPLPPIPDPLHVRARALAVPRAAEGTNDFRGLVERALGDSLESPQARRARRTAEILDLPASDRADATPGERERHQLKQVAAQFESLMFELMMKSMRKTIDKSELFGGGRGEEVFQGLLDQEISTGAAKGPGLGIGRMIYEQMAQHVAPKAPAGLDSYR